MAAVTTRLDLCLIPTEVASKFANRSLILWIKNQLINHDLCECSPSHFTLRINIFPALQVWHGQWSNELSINWMLY